MQYKISLLEKLCQFQQKSETHKTWKYNYITKLICFLSFHFSVTIDVVLHWIVCIIRYSIYFHRWIAYLNRNQNVSKLRKLIIITLLEKMRTFRYWIITDYKIENKSTTLIVFWKMNCTKKTKMKTSGLTQDVFYILEM